MAGNGRRSADETLIVLLAAGKAVTEAAAQSGLSERTIYRRLEEPEFRQHASRQLEFNRIASRKNHTGPGGIASGKILPDDAFTAGELALKSGSEGGMGHQLIG